MPRLRLILVLFAFLLPGFTANAAQSATKRHEPLEVGDQVALYARKFVGVPYSYGGMSPRSGFDCSGLVSFVYRHFGIALPHYTVAQLSTGRHIRRRRVRPGDLLFFGLGHVGLYLGNGRFIHAPHTGARVRIERLSRWHLTAVRRVT